MGLDTEIVRVENRHYVGNRGTHRFRRKIAAYKRDNVQYTIDGDNIIQTKEVSARDYLGDERNGLLFYQKPLKSQRNLLSKCRYESEKKVCHISHPLFEYYRALQFINTIEYGQNHALSDDQREDARMFLLNKKDAVKMKEIKKKLELSHETFNYPDDHSIPGCTTIVAINKITDCKDNRSIDFDQYHRIWEWLIFYDDTKMLHEKLKKELNTTISIDDLEKIKLKEDYGSLSLKAIRNIVPFLERGMQYHEAVIYAGIKRVLGDRWGKTSFDTLEKEIIALRSASHGENKRFIDWLKKYLIEKYNIPEEATERLYHHSQEITVENKMRVMPELPNLRNPIVQQALQEMRTVVNGISKKFLRDDERFARIKIELARELKLPKDIRQKMIHENQERYAFNEQARIELRSFGFALSRDNIQKYKLYKEIEEQTHGPVQCPYTGKTLSYHDVFGPEGHVEVEHIIPLSISLDDSLGNKTLCVAKENRDKGERTPYQFYQQNEKKWEEVKQRAFALLPYGKAKRFVSENEPERDGFIQRQLNDTRYISKKAKECLESICNTVQVFPGGLTATIRRRWGMDSILSPPIRAFSLLFDETHPTKCWGVFNDKNEITELHEILRQPPRISTQQILVTGDIKQNKFHIDKKFLGNTTERTVQIRNPEADGRAWIVYDIKSIVSFTAKFTPLPDSAHNQIWLKGSMQVNTKGCVFNIDSLYTNITIDTQGETYTDKQKCWALFNTTIHIAKSREKGGKNEILKRAKIVDRHADIWIDKRRSSIPIDHPDGEYSLIVTFDLQNPVNITSMWNPYPDISESQLLFDGTLTKDGELHLTGNRNINERIKNSEHRNVPVWVIADCEPIAKSYLKYTPPPKGNNIVAGQVLKTDERLLFYPEKNRMDHRHHAVDALTISLLNISQLQQLSSYNAQRKEYTRGKIARPQFELPWINFRHDAEVAIKNILVVHRQQKKIIKTVSKNIHAHGRKFTVRSTSVGGQLHKETIYGRRKSPHEIEHSYHIRKSVLDLDGVAIDKIVDHKTKQMIRECALKRDDKKGKKKDKIDSKALYADNEYMLSMPNKRHPEQAHPIKKIRIRENFGNARQLHDNINQYVDLQNNYCVILYKAGDSIEENIVSFWDAVQAKINNDNIYALPAGATEIIATLHENDLFILDTDIEDVQKLHTWSRERISQHLYRVQTLSAKDYRFRLHSEGTLQKDFFPFYVRIASFKAWKRHNPIKVQLTPLGDIILP